MMNKDNISLEISGDEYANCPGIYEGKYCMYDGWIKPEFNNIPMIFSMISCSLSVIGSLLMILPYVLWKDLRTGVRAIVTFLAIADLFTALGYIMGSCNKLMYTKQRKDSEIKACQEFDTVCQIQAYISSWSSLSSFWWTAILAFYLYWTIAKGDTQKVNRYFPLYHILAWSSPLLVMFPLLATHSLGYSLFAASGWCFIRGDKINGYSAYTDFHLSSKTILLILAGGKAFEIATYFWVVILYSMIYCKIHKKNKPDIHSTDNNNPATVATTLLRQVEKKLYTIPIFFILLRIWGTLQFIFSIGVFACHKVDQTGCVPPTIFHIYYVLAIMQSIGDGGQGWCNAILYIFWNRKIRERLIMNPFRMIYLHVGEYVLHSGSASHNTTFAIRSCTNDSGPSVWKTSTQWYDRDGEERRSRFLFEEAAVESSSVNLT